MISVRTMLALCGIFASAPTWAHHGKDFLIVESYDIPRPGDVYALASASYEKDNSAEGWQLEPAVLIGAFPRLAAEVHAHFVKDDDTGSFRYEAIAPSIHFQLTDRASTSPIQVGLSAEYEIAADDASDVLEGRLIVEKGFSNAKLSLNIIVEHVASEDTEFGYAAGIRMEINRIIATGLEVQGSLEAEGTHDALVGVYFEPAERFTLKVGAGTGFGANGLDVAARVGAIYRF